MKNDTHQRSITDFMEPSVSASNQELRSIVEEGSEQSEVPSPESNKSSEISNPIAVAKGSVPTPKKADLKDLIAED